MCATRSCTTSTSSTASRPKARASSRSCREIPDDAVTIFSAHGVAKSVEEEAAGRGLPVLNATCPLVTKVHNQGKRYVGQGRTLILIGHAGHPEVEGTMGQIAGPVVLVQTEEDVEKLDIPADTPVAYVTQTTLSVDDTRASSPRSSSASAISSVPRRGTSATRRRTASRRCASSVAQVDVILVVGAKNSSNSNRLREIGRGGRHSELSDRRRQRAAAGMGRGRARRRASPRAPRRRRCWSTT